LTARAVRRHSRLHLPIKRKRKLRMFIDSHAHLQFERFDGDREDVIERAFAAGVRYIINVGIDLQTSRQSLDIARKYPTLFSSVGVHPHEAGSYSPGMRQPLLELLKDGKAVAVGEIGLDYYRSAVPRDVQRRVFKEQLSIAREAGLPVIIHTRNAWEDIEEAIDGAADGTMRGVFHCYSGDLETALRLVKKGFLISFAGNITFGNYKETGMLARIPVEKMLIETDCPFLAPHPYRGKRSEPAYIPLIAQRLADIKGLSAGDIGRITLFNAHRLFGIAPEMDEGKVVYRIRDSLYINPTNRCSAHCVFCARLIDPVVKGHNLKLTREPTARETIDLIEREDKAFSEVVFCGYGEPTIRLDYVKEVARWLKSRGYTVRLNTNGHGNLIHQRDITPELFGLIDEISVSINTHSEVQYKKIMRAEFNSEAFQGMLDFLKKSGAAGIRTAATVVGIPGLDIEKSRRLAAKTGAEFRVRAYNEVG